MKSIAKKISVYCMVCIMILAICGNVNTASAYEFTETDEGKVLKISTAELYDACVKNKKCDRLIVTGKISKSVFWFIEDLECEILDLSDLDIDVIPHQSFIGNENLKKVILPKCLKKIEQACFTHCYNLETVVLPENLKFIGGGSFGKCPQLKMEVPSNIELGKNAFYHSPGVIILEPEPLCGCLSWFWRWFDKPKEKAV